MYKKLMLDTCQITLHIKGQWELEQNTIVDEDAGQTICLRCCVEWKVKMRFFWTLLTACVFKNNSTNKCWRNCDMVDEIPKIQTFWKTITEEMEKLLEMDIPLDLHLFLFEVSPEHLLTTDQ